MDFFASLQNQYLRLMFVVSLGILTTIQSIRIANFSLSTAFRLALKYFQ